MSMITSNVQEQMRSISHSHLQHTSIIQSVHTTAQRYYCLTVSISCLLESKTGLQSEPKLKLEILSMLETPLLMAHPQPSPTFFTHPQPCGTCRNRSFACVSCLTHRSGLIYNHTITFNRWTFDEGARKIWVQARATWRTLVITLVKRQGRTFCVSASCTLVKKINLTKTRYIGTTKLTPGGAQATNIRFARWRFKTIRGYAGRRCVHT